MSRTAERGAVLVESALTLGVFLLFMFGVMEMARVMSVQDTITNAAREGARVAVLPLRGTSTLPSADVVAARVRRFLDANAIGSAGATVVLTTETSAAPLTVYTTVTVSVPYELLTISPFAKLKVAISGQARMRNETSP